MNRPLRSGDPCWCGSGQKYKRCHQRALLAPGRLSPPRAVPDGIARPDYAGSGTPRRWAESPVKSPDMIARLRRAGQVAAEVLQAGGAVVRPGITTDEIDAVVHEACVARGVYPSPLNYNRFPKSVCTSVNEVICHGIPDDRPLADGDIVNIDVTVYTDGVHGDTNATFLVGDVDPASRRLVEITRSCLEAGIAAVAPGRPLSDIGLAIQRLAERHGYSVVRAFVGHGIGEQFHGEPTVFHYFEPAATAVMEPGMVFTIEPMISMGSWAHRLWDDGWTAVTVDGSRTAQFEHTLVVTEAGADVLTLPAPDRSLTAGER